MVARAHQTLIWERTRHMLRLRAALRDFFPAALDAFDDLTAPDTLELLATAPDPAAAATAVARPDHCGAASGPAAATSPPRPQRSRPRCGPSTWASPRSGRRAYAATVRAQVA